MAQGLVIWTNEIEFRHLSTDLTGNTKKHGEGNLLTVLKIFIPLWIYNKQKQTGK